MQQREGRPGGAAAGVSLEGGGGRAGGGESAARVLEAGFRRGLGGVGFSEPGTRALVLVVTHHPTAQIIPSYFVS